MNKLPNPRKNKNNFFFTLWLIFHLGIVAAFLLVFAFSRDKLKLETDLFNLIPKSLSLESVRKADEKMLSKTSRNVFILVANRDFQSAKNVAENIFEELNSSENFESVSLYNDMAFISDMTDFLFKYRWNMLDQKTIDSINSDGGDSFALGALSKAYSGFTMLPLDNLELDPFLLAEHNFSSYLSSVQKSGTAMSLVDGVLASQYEGEWYIMIRAVLSKKGSALASKKNGVSEIYSACRRFENLNGDSREKTHFIYSGVPYHSSQSSNAAAREISIIATISMLVVIAILILVFKSPKPVIFSAGSILISIVAAFLATISVFREMHIITLVFGTSLIGSCIDYSLHYFIHWAGSRSLKTGSDIRAKLLPELSMAICSTGICFAVLLFAPFAILKQMSLFCLTGLLCSFLTTIAIYPKIKIPAGERKLPLADKFRFVVDRVQNKTVGRITITALFVFSIASIIVFHGNIRIKNNILSLYKMQGKLLDDEITAGKIIKYNPSGWYIVGGETEQQALENEENFRHAFEEKTSGKAGYMSTSLFIPSIEQQKKSRYASEKLLKLAAHQLQSLGYEKKFTEKLKADFEQSAGDFISFAAGNVPEFITSSISSVWIGEVEGKYYSVLLPNSVEDYEFFRSIADGFEDVHFVSKSADVSRDLDKLTVMVIKFFVAAYILMLIMLRFFYSWKQSLKIISVPLLIVLVTVAVFGIAKINLEFFSVTGLILVFGLGLDYIIYMIENEKSIEKEKILEPFATMLSFVTTVISFGALALSAFQPVRLIGLSIFIGLTTAYLSSFFYARDNGTAQDVG